MSGLSIDGTGPRACLQIGSRAGRAGALPVALLAGFLIGVGILFLIFGGPGHDGARGETISPIAPSGNEGANGSSERPARLSSPPETAPDPAAQREEHAHDPGTPHPEDLALTARAGQAADPKRFEGQGELRGEVHAREGDMPTTWRLLLEPSRYLVGQEHAVRREVTFENTESFHVEGLPLAGYDLRVLADGWNSRRVPLLLDRANPSAFVNLELIPASYVEGLLLTADRLPADGIQVTLEAQADRTRLELTSDAAGRFAFQDVLDGNYRLIVGEVTSPLVDPLSLTVTAPGMAMPGIQLPALGHIRFLVLGPVDEPIANARIRGSGPGGGSVDVTTDAQGRCEARHLPFGRFRVRAEHTTYGSRRSAFDVTAAEPQEITLRLSP